MKLCVPTNWDNELIEGLARINEKNHNIYEVFGSLPFGIVPGGRAPFGLPQVTREQAEEHIRLAKSKGIKFNYIMNAGSLMNQEYTIPGRSKISEYISWIVSAGADSITIGIPILLEHIKKKYPHVNVNISVQGGVATPIEAKRFENLGAGRIVLRRRCNRDFKVLKEIKKAVKSDLCVFVNLDCINQCTMMFYHLSHPNHVCQNPNGSYVTYIDYPKISCSLVKALDIVEFIKSRWIRPEDLKEYEALGIEYFKIIDRRMPTDKILKIVEAYSNQKYEGNLNDLFYYLPKPQVFLNQLKKKLPEAYEKINGDVLSEIPVPTMQIDNKKLDGFLEFFKNHDCSSGCGDCNYCAEISKKVMKIENPQEFEDYANALKKIKEEVSNL
ncbi:peptidase family U32 [archaeon BMS3Abin17]|nr:peptidase family U32 [archaeon BMS3Abin17]